MDYQKQSWKNSDYWICIHQADRIKQLPTQACGYLSSCASKHMLAIVFSVLAWVGQEMFLHVIAHEWPQKNERDLTDEERKLNYPFTSANMHNSIIFLAESLLQIRGLTAFRAKNTKKKHLSFVMIRTASSRTHGVRLNLFPEEDVDTTVLVYHTAPSGPLGRVRTEKQSSAWWCSRRGDRPSTVWHAFKLPCQRAATLLKCL